MSMSAGDPGSHIILDRISDLTAIVQTLAGGVEAFRADVAAGFRDQAAGIARLGDGVTALENHMTSLADHMTSLEDRMTAIEDRMTSLEDRMTAVEGHMAAIEDRMTALEDRMTALEEATAVLNGRMNAQEAALLKTRSEIMDRIDRLQGTVETVREDLSVNWAASSNAITSVRNTRRDIEGIHKIISAMERRYQILAAQVEELRNPDGRKASNG